MTAPVLVAYATQYGSTQEVAENVAATLRKHGLEVDVQLMRLTKSLEGRRAIVLGAPIYIGRFHKDAQRFLIEHRGELAECPVAVFALGPLGTEDEQPPEGTNEQLDTELKNYPWLNPVAHELFGGKYDPHKLSLPHKLLTALPASPFHGAKGSDRRD